MMKIFLAGVCAHMGKRYANVNRADGRDSWAGPPE